MRRRDLYALAALALWLAALVAFRAAVIEPRAWAAACETAASPWFGAAAAAGPCALRGLVLWGQQYGVWGGAALALGLAALLGLPTIMLAIGLGLVGVVNYDVSFAMLGLALAAWAWISPPAKAGQTHPRAAA
jgi:hypothetical protein